MKYLIVYLQPTIDFVAYSILLCMFIIVLTMTWWGWYCVADPHELTYSLPPYSNTGLKKTMIKQLNVCRTLYHIISVLLKNLQKPGECTNRIIITCLCSGANIAWEHNVLAWGLTAPSDQNYSTLIDWLVESEIRFRVGHIISITWPINNVSASIAWPPQL